MRWLPTKRKAQFIVADQIGGFHPKAVFWREGKRKCFAIIGSSNLTQAAFKSNYEANVFLPLTEIDYVKGKKWVKNIEKQSVVVSEDWLRKYKEAPLRSQGGANNGNQHANPVVELKLPTPSGMEELIKARRAQFAIFKKKQAGLMHLFRRCASNKLTSEQFYNELPKYWSAKLADRLQGRGWERLGAGSDFQALSKSLVRILDTAEDDRDDIVSSEIDRLRELRVPTRGAFFRKCSVYDSR